MNEVRIQRLRQAIETPRYKTKAEARKAYDRLRQRPENTRPPNAMGGPYFGADGRVHTVGDFLRGHSPCELKRMRRAVLLAAGKVNKPGGAPGPYKPRDGVKCK